MGTEPNYKDVRSVTGHDFVRQTVRCISAALVCSVGLLSVSRAQSPVERFDKDRAWQFLTRQVAFGPRKPGSDAHLKCRDYLYTELGKTCENVRLQPFEHRWTSNGENIKMWNIIGEQNYQKASVRVALVAHWDTRPTADQESSFARAQQPIPGANDGASGVAVLMELMRAIRDHHPEVGVMVVLVDGEDLGPGLDEMFLGAEAFAAKLPDPKPTYGILLDMIGQKNVVVPKEPNSASLAGDLLRRLYLHAAKVGLKDTFPSYFGPTIEDDHLALNRAKVPTVDLIDFNYAPWHTLDDTVDKCSAESLGKIGKLLETWIESPEAAIAGSVNH